MFFTFINAPLVHCDYSACVQVFGLYLSTYIVVIISIDRCIAILDPISKNRGPHRVKVMIGIAWVLSAVFGLPQVRPTTSWAVLRHPLYGVRTLWVVPWVVGLL